jgi:hypothetical protein
VHASPATWAGTRTASSGPGYRWTCEESSRAESGNSLSWAYTFEWPIFAGFVIVFWAKTIKDEFRPPAPAEGLDSVALPAGRDGAAGADLAAGSAEAAVADGEDDEELAAYNAYLARLTDEASRHGKWHGLR